MISVKKILLKYTQSFIGTKPLIFDIDATIENISCFQCGCDMFNYRAKNKKARYKEFKDETISAHEFIGFCW